MKQTKVLSGIAIATLSTVSVAVNADEVKSLSLETTANQTNHITEVTQEQVDSAKAKSDRATSDVETQQNVVNTAQNQQNQAQQTLVNATKKLNATQKLAQESTQENKVKAQQTIDIAKQMLSQIEAKQKTAETEQVKAQEAVKAQQIVVANDKKDVVTKTVDVEQISVVKSSVLPSTGDAKTGLIAVLGMLLSLSGFLGIRKNNKNNI